MREHFKPFDLNLAKQGAPVGAAAERITIEILKYTDHLVIGTIAYGTTHENAMSWKHDGVSNLGPESDLVMLPLGYCEGKPVFVGDELIDKEDGHKVAATPLWKNMDGTLWKWPKPEPKYPETRMTWDDLCEHYFLYGKTIEETMETWSSASSKNLANEAIKHAIQCGDVFTKQQVTAVLEELRNICLRHANPLNIRDIVDGTDWDGILKGAMQ